MSGGSAALLLELALLAEELVEEDGDEAECGDAGRLDTGDGVLLVGHGLDVVAGHEDQQKDKPHDKEANEDGNEACSSISYSLGVAGEYITLLPSEINAVAPDTDGGKREEEGDEESDLFTVRSVRCRVLDSELFDGVRGRGLETNVLAVSVRSDGHVSLIPVVRNVVANVGGHAQDVEAGIDGFDLEFADV